MYKRVYLFLITYYKIIIPLYKQIFFQQPEEPGSEKHVRLRWHDKKLVHDNIFYGYNVKISVTLKQNK